MIRQVNQRIFNKLTQQSLRPQFSINRKLTKLYSTQLEVDSSSQLVHKKFSDLDVRIGKVLKVEIHPNNDQQYISKVQLTKDCDPITVVSGLVPFLKLNELEGQLVTLMMNLKSTKFRGILSEAMILCGTNNATDINQVKLQLLQPKLSIDTNTRVQLRSLPDLADPLAVIKKKNYEAEYASHFTTDTNCNGLFQNHQLVVLNPNDLSTPIPLVADGIPNGIIH